MAHFREKFGNDYEIVATSWDVPSEVESQDFHTKTNNRPRILFSKLKIKMETKEF